MRQMKLTLLNMKTTRKTLFVLCAFLAFGVATLCAQTNAQLEEPLVTNAPTGEVVTNIDTTTNTVGGAKIKKKTQSSRSAPGVRIGPEGISVGGDEPVEIRIPHRMSSSSFLEGLIPLTAIVMSLGFPIAIVALAFYFRHRKNKLLHETIRAMVDKGVAIPPELFNTPAQAAPQRTRNDLRSGLVLIAVGAGLFLMMPSSVGRIGAIPLLIGVAFLVTWKIDQKKKDQVEK
jgi:Domain of unknown function (DUF6249)